MIIKILLLSASLLFMSACSVKTQIIEPDGSIYVIKSKTDSLVVMSKGDWKVTVDNRGKPNIFESLLGWMLLKTPEINQGK